MRRPTRIPILALSVAVALASAAALADPAAADTRLEMKSHTDAFQVMGQSHPARDLEVVYWIGDDRALRDDGEQGFLLRADRKKLYVLDHQAKTYSVVDLPVDFAALVPPESRAQMEEMLQAMEMQATVTPTDERREINGWPARRWDVHLENRMGITMDSEVWVTDGIEADVESLRQLTRAFASLQPGGGAAVEELLRIEGVPVLTEIRMAGLGGSTSSREELAAAEQVEAPPGTYEVPEGYTEAPLNPMGGGPGGR